MTVRIGLLNAAFSDGTYDNFNREVKNGEVVNINAHNAAFPDVEAFDGFLVTGSRVSVYDDSEANWVKPLEAYIASIAADEIPIMGICFGHQVIADALGGAVVGMDEYEIGYAKIRQFVSDRVFDGLENPTTVFESHSDTVVKLPPQTQIIAANEYGVQAYRRENVFGVQFHPEFDVDSARKAVTAKDFDEEREQYLLDQITEDTHRSVQPTSCVLTNFVEYVKEETQ